MGNLSGKLSALLLMTSSMLAASAEAATFSVSTVACGPQGNCDYGPFQSTAPGAPPANSAVAKSYVFVPPPGSGGGYSIGVNSSVALGAPDTWRVYAQAGGYINVQEFALDTDLPKGESPVVGCRRSLDSADSSAGSHAVNKQVSPYFARRKPIAI